MELFRFSYCEDCVIIVKDDGTYWTAKNHHDTPAGWWKVESEFLFFKRHSDSEFTRYVPRQGDQYVVEFCDKFWLGLLGVAFEKDILDA